MLIADSDSNYLAVQVFRQRIRCANLCAFTGWNRHINLIGLQNISICIQNFRSQTADCFIAVVVNRQSQRKFLSGNNIFRIIVEILLH